MLNIIELDGYLNGMKRKVTITNQQNEFQTRAKRINSIFSAVSNPLQLSQLGRTSTTIKSTNSTVKDFSQKPV